MRVFTFVPKSCQGEDAKFEGSITLRVLKIDERFEFIENCGFELGEGGVTSVQGSQLSSVRKMLKHSEPFYQSVTLKHKASGEEFKSYEDLTFEPDATEIMMEVANLILNGMKPSKN